MVHIDQLEVIIEFCYIDVTYECFEKKTEKYLTVNDIRVKNIKGNLIKVVSNMTTSRNLDMCVPVF